MEFLPLPPEWFIPQGKNHRLCYHISVKIQNIYADIREDRKNKHIPYQIDDSLEYFRNWALVFIKTKKPKARSFNLAYSFD